MSSKKVKKDLLVEGSSKFELEPLMKFQEIPLDKAIKILEQSGIIVSEEEVSNILQFLHTLAKITIKEFLTTKD